MSKKTVLSICIPTFNRSSFLKRNLYVIASLIGSKDIEIVICDDGSIDNTPEVISEFKKDNPNLRVIDKRFKKTVSFDRNVLEMVKIANGNFCWLLGDDDVPVRRSLEKILSVISKHPNLSLIHLNYSRFDNLLKKVTAKKMVNGIRKDILFKKYEDFYFKPIKNSYFKFLGTHTITMSSDVVNRKKWLTASKRLKKYIGHNFIHSFVIGTIIKGENSVYFVSDPQVQYLSNNHRVWPNDIWRDYNDELLGYLKSIGYSEQKINQMQKQQREYEGREEIMKNKFIKYLYPILGPVYSKFIMFKNKFVS